MRKKVTLIVLAVSLIIALNGQTFKTIEKDIELHTLDNGARLILVPRPGVPIVNLVSFVDAGGVKEYPGITGVSHYLEHLAFKGTETIGTSDYEQEKIALDKCHEIFDLILEERSKGSEADSAEIDSLQGRLDKAIEEANEFVNDNEFSKTLELNGAMYLNAATGQDMTMYMVSLPANKIELWMLMEADRFTNPVFREFYAERQVILEEMRMINSNPFRKFLNELMGFAFRNNPYRYSIIGSEEDVTSMTVQKVEDYFEQHYGAKNLVFTIVGDFETEEVLRMANQYLATIPSRSLSPRIEFNEPEPSEEQYFTSQAQSQPYLVLSYYAPSAADPDFPVYRVIADIMGQGRSSRLHREMVEEKRLAVSTFAFNGMPGNAYDNLFIVGAIPAQGVTLQECIDGIDEIIREMKTEAVSQRELDGVKKRALRQSVERLRSGIGLGYQLATYESLTGDYRGLFRELQQTNDVTQDDIIRIMNRTFQSKNRIVGELQTVGG
jgi:predicted Zn-dependent peptidase